MIIQPTFFGPFFLFHEFQRRQNYCLKIQHFCQQQSSLFIHINSDCFVAPLVSKVSLCFRLLKNHVCISTLCNPDLILFSISNSKCTNDQKHNFKTHLTLQLSSVNANNNYLNLLIEKVLTFLHGNNT